MVTTNRLFQDFISFTIDTDPGAAGLSLSGPGLTDLLVVASPDFIALTIDPQEVDGDSEIIWVSVHTSAATTATIIRGQEGTTGRAHNIGTIVKASVTQDSLDEFLREKAFGGVAAEVPVHDHSAAAEAGLLVFAGWQLTKSVDQDDTGTHDVTWDVEDIDTNGFHTGSNADITVPSGLGGTYLVKAALRSTAHSSTNAHEYILYKNATKIASVREDGADDGVPGQTTARIEIYVVLVATDTMKVELQANGLGGTDTVIRWDVNGNGAPASFFTGHRIAV